jgi:hypothetical protein
MSYSDFLTPRRDVLSEDGIEGIIDLANLADTRKRKLEVRPADFFALTYPTADARRVIDTIHRRFSGNRDAPGLFLFEGLKGSGRDRGATREHLLRAVCTPTTDINEFEQALLMLQRYGSYCHV